MKTDLPFLELSPSADLVEVDLNGAPLHLPEGANLAAALLGQGIRVLRHTAQGAPRGAFCMMGACFDCVIEIDGTTRQACMTQVRAGMVLRLAGATR